MVSPCNCLYTSYISLNKRPFNCHVTVSCLTGSFLIPVLQCLVSSRQLSNSLVTVSCPAGSFLNTNLALPACELCPSGTYQDQSGAKYCVLCALESYTDDTLSTPFIDCLRK